MDELRMSREEDIESNENIGVLHYGKRFRYSKKETMAKREEHHIVFEKRDPLCSILDHIVQRKEREIKISSI
jgi:hypothetical protein